MQRSAKTRRRWFGALCLLGALGMLLAGQTTLQERLAGIAFLLYWLVCLVLTLLAMAAALIDAFALRREGRDRQRVLIEDTVQEILSARKTPPDKKSRPGS